MKQVNLTFIWLILASFLVTCDHRQNENDGSSDISTRNSFWIVKSNQSKTEFIFTMVSDSNLYFKLSIYENSYDTVVSQWKEMLLYVASEPCMYEPFKGLGGYAGLIWFDDGCQCFEGNTNLCSEVLEFVKGEMAKNSIDDFKSLRWFMRSRFHPN